MSPTSPFSEIGSPSSVQESMQTEERPVREHHQTPVRSTPNLHQGVAPTQSKMSVSGSDLSKCFHSLLPTLCGQQKSECSFYRQKQALPSAANIFIGAEMSVDPTPEDENLLNEVQVDAIFDSLTSSDFEADTFIRSLLNDTGLDMGDC